MNDHEWAEIDASRTHEDQTAPPGRLHEVRFLLVKVAAIDKEIEEQRELRGECLRDHDEYIEKLARRKTDLREAILGYCSRHGNAVLPGVGTAYPITTKATIDVADPEVFRAWCVEEGFTKADENEGKKAAKTILRETGEITDGMTEVPEKQTLGIRFKEGTN